MFNDASSEFDVLVASDAIGMGLNLNISRIIFSTMKKFDGVEMRDLMISEVKQIAGTVLCEISFVKLFGLTISITGFVCQFHSGHGDFPVWPKAWSKQCDKLWISSAMNSIII